MMRMMLMLIVIVFRLDKTINTAINANPSAIVFLSPASNLISIYHILHYT